jgi:hypothetical protein
MLCEAVFNIDKDHRAFSISMKIDLALSISIVGEVRINANVIPEMAVSTVISCLLHSQKVNSCKKGEK